jgi:tRNA G10  N-methylase Trm11
VTALGVGDALTVAPPRGLSLILTNPPMGRRVLRHQDVAALLERFVARAAAVLPPGGRLVWISPAPERTHAAAARAGLGVDLRRTVDMGGFDAEIQSFVRRGQLPK